MVTLVVTKEGREALTKPLAVLLCAVFDDLRAVPDRAEMRACEPRPCGGSAADTGSTQRDPVVALLFPFRHGQRLPLQVLTGKMPFYEVLGES